jgi:cysteine desulfurase
LKDRGILFHTDAVQAVGHVPVDVRGLGIDFLTASAHKFNGPKGTGFLFKRSGLGLPPLVFGGSQEMGLRGGTENVAGIVAAGHAIAENVTDMGETAERLRAMVDATIGGILAGTPTAKVLGSSGNRLPGLVNIVFDGVSGESMMHLLDLKGICVSTGSACASGDAGASHVLLALGLTDAEARSAIRISYGRYNTAEDAGEVASALRNAYEKIRASQ